MPHQLEEEGLFIPYVANLDPELSDSPGIQSGDLLLGMGAVLRYQSSAEGELIALLVIYRPLVRRLYGDCWVLRGREVDIDDSPLPPLPLCPKVKQLPYFDVRPNAALQIVFPEYFLSLSLAGK